jgi:hypothetical protein
MALRTNYFFALIAICGVVSDSAALQAQSCSDTIKECFAYTDAERDRCFKQAGDSPACADSLEGSLARRRAQFSPLLPSDSATGPSFLGPQLVDRACIAKFDSAWSGALVKGTLSQETAANLTSSLDRCAYNQASDVMRP